MSSNTPHSSLTTLPLELQLLNRDHLPFYDLYALRLTNRHFTSITPLLRNLQEQYDELRDQAYDADEDVEDLKDQFNRSWLAVSSDVEAFECCTGAEGCHEWVTAESRRMA